MFYGALWSDPSIRPNKRAKTERASCRHSWERRSGIDRFIAVARGLKERDESFQRARWNDPNKRPHHLLPRQQQRKGMDRSVVRCGAIHRKGRKGMDRSMVRCGVIHRKGMDCSNARDGTIQPRLDGASCRQG